MRRKLRQTHSACCYQLTEKPRLLKCCRCWRHITKGQFKSQMWFRNDRMLKPLIAKHTLWPLFNLAIWLQEF